MSRQTDRITHIKAARQTDRMTHIKAARQTDRHRKKTTGQTDRQTYTRRHIPA